MYAGQYSENILEEENLVEEDDKEDYAIQSEIDFAPENLKTIKHAV